MPESLWSRSEWPRLALLAPWVVSSGLAALVAYEMLSIGRVLSRQGEFSVLANPPREVGGSVAPAAGPTENFAALADAHLFGQLVALPPAASEPPSFATDAPATVLPLKLTGTVVTRGEAAAQAVISGAGDLQTLYTVGDAIADVEATTLRAVYVDRVILERGGGFETLAMSEEFSTAELPALVTDSRNPDEPSAGDPVDPAGAALAELVRWSPQTTAGRFQGFRLLPGPQHAAFTAAGLERNDLLTEVNGVALRDLGASARLLKEIGAETTAVLTVQRNNGEQRVIAVDLPRAQLAARATP